MYSGNNSEKRPAPMFSGRQIWALLIPLMIEQVLTAFMGTVDTMMVSNAGSAAISAVALVDSLNILIIYMFAAMATGGTIICSQYIGSGQNDKANHIGEQLIVTVFWLASVLMAVCIGLRKPLLHLIFGQVEADVMTNADVYFLITALSYPFVALYNAGAALFRASGNSRLPMQVSTISNLLNIIGNAIMIFGFHKGVAGAAFATLLSRIFCAVVIMYDLRKPNQVIIIRDYIKIKWDSDSILRILKVGIPNGVENGMFQFGKIAVQSTVSTMGTIAIAAQAMAASMEGLASYASMGIGLGMMTIVGQCIGADRKEEAKRYILQLTWYAEVGILICCALMVWITPLVTRLAGMEPAAAEMTCWMVRIIAMVKIFLWTPSFLPAYGMRGAGDVRFSMILTMCTMWTCRVLVVVILARFFGFGPIAVWIGVFIDWGVRGIFFTYRFFSGKWMEKKVL